MGRGSSKAGGGGGGTAKTPPPIPASQVQPVGANVPTNATTMTDQMAANLRAQEDSNYNATAKAAIKMYISNTDFDNQGHSLSQTMNYLLDNGVDLATADVNSVNKQFGLNLSSADMSSMQYTYGQMNANFHPIGTSVNLQRGAHDGLLKSAFGISDYSSMSEKQLQSALVGQAFRNTSPMSTSYDIKRNPFLSSSSGVSGGREVVYNIKAGPKTPMLFGAQKQSEVVLGYSNFKITGVKYTGKTATPRGGRSKPQIQIDIETF